MTTTAARPKTVKNKNLGKRIADHWQLYVLLLIPVIITIVYKYGPMYGIQIAFRNYNPGLGITGSPWVGWKWFERFFRAPNFDRMLWNTIKLSVYGLLWGFPVPILLSLMLNQLRFKKLKRTVQTVIYAPHFISTMVICGMLRMTEASAFRTIYVASGIWQEAGWGTIIYLATLSSIDPALYEAAKVDGASVFQRILHIDIPCLLPMIILQLIMSASGIMNVGFEKAYLLQTDLNRATSDIIAIYVYEQGIVSARYELGTAVGLFNTAINIVLLVIVNRVAKKYGEVNFV